MKNFIKTPFRNKIIFNFISQQDGYYVNWQFFADWCKETVSKAWSLILSRRQILLWHTLFTVENANISQKRHIQPYKYFRKKSKLRPQQYQKLRRFDWKTRETMQIVIFDYFEISLFAIVSRDFQREDQMRRSFLQH